MANNLNRTNVHFQLKDVDYNISYDQQPECKRHVIGAYANLARHNMTLAVNTIMQAVGMDIFNENEIEKAFGPGHRKKIAQLDNIQKVNLQKRLYRHFPFFKRMKLEDETKKSVQLNKLLKVMADFTGCMAMLRNYYTHYHPYNTPEEEKRQFELRKAMGKILQYLYENTCQLFKSNEALDHESNEVLSALRIPEKYTQVIKPGDSEYKKTSDFYFNPKISEKKKRGIKYNPNTMVFEKEAVKFVPNPEYQAYMMDDEKGMSDTAIIYFLCLFLEKKVSFDLMDEVGFTKQIKFKGEHADQQLLYIKEIMCMNRIRMTKTKLDSEMTDTALALDMINELRKCPKPLYEVFCKEARDEFKDDATVIWEREHGHEAIATEETQEPDNDQELSEITDKNTPRSTFVRWEDRFPQMALKYIDMTRMFDDIRFQLNLGKYRFAFYMHNEKYSVDGQERLRILQKEIHGFGRPIEVDEKKSMKWASLFNQKTIQDGLTLKEPDTAGQDPYITEQRAQYAIDEKAHSIGLRWEGWDNPNRKTIVDEVGKEKKEPHYGDLDREKMFVPYLPLKPKPQKRQTNQAESLLAPQCTLSLYELPGLLFYQYLMTKYKGSKYDAESVVKNTFSNLNLFFSDVAKGVLCPVEGKDEDTRKQELEKLLKKKYKLQLSSVPEKLKMYLIGSNVDNAQRMKSSALRRLNERRERKNKALESFRNKKKIIGSKENKFDKMRSTIKTGSLGQLLARDIMEWLTDETKGKMNLTGQNYVAMQTALALLGQRFDDNSEEVTWHKLRDIFVSANILPQNADDYDADLHHPFLLNVLDKAPTSVEKFYEVYLEEEINHIDYITTLFKKHKAKGIGLYIPFLHVNRIRWQNTDAEGMKKLASRYTERPLQLPNGMFKTPILHLLMEINYPKLHEALEKTQNDENGEQLSNNLAYLMKLYFKYVECDHSQPFYNTTAIDGQPSPYRHVYRIFKKLYGENIPHTNRTTSPAYSIEELRELRKKAIEDIKAYVDKEIHAWKEKRIKKLEKKLTDILKKENDRRYKKHEEQLNINEEVKAAVEKEEVAMLPEVEAMRHEMTSKLEKQLKKVYDNERTIRRYKTQDILLLIMARDILNVKSQEGEVNPNFCLKYVTTDSLLDQPIDFKWKVRVKTKDGSKTKIIEQKGMKMKNYGQFYKFASDHQRLTSLLSRLPDNIFLRSEIENEFSYYDTNRSEVFRQVYIIESEAYKLKPELKDDDNANEEWFCYVDNKGKKHPKRNNFLSLLEILAAGKDGILDEGEKRSLQSTRNAFGHNTYDVDLPAVFKGKEEKMKVPEVANGIKDKIKEQTVELKKNLRT